MARTVSIYSASQLSSLLESSTIVVTFFHSPSQLLAEHFAPIYGILAAELTRPHKVIFTQIDFEPHIDIAQSYGVAKTPAIVIFKRGEIVETIPPEGFSKLDFVDSVMQKLAAEADGDGSAGAFGETSGGGPWLGRPLPKGYNDITDQVDAKGLDLLNADGAFGDARGLFVGTKPSALLSGKGKQAESEGEVEKDWVESDTDEQLMLYMPFKSTLKIHTLHITSLPPAGEEGEQEDGAPMRPKTVQLYSNRAHVLGFDEAEGIPPTQSITIKPEDWDPATGTAKVELRFVKFQNVTSLVLFVVDGEGDGEKVRIDRLRLIGESGEKRDMGKLEKIGDETG